MSKPDDIIFRVIQLPQDVISKFRSIRDEQGEKNEDFVVKSIEQHLPRILEGLRSLGFGKADGRRRNIRLPFNAKNKTLEKLRSASAAIQIPAVTLLGLCIKATTLANPKVTRTRKRLTKPIATEKVSSN